MAFVRPALRDVSGTDAGCVGTLLLGYGVAGVAGNLLAGARDAYRTPLHRGPAGTGPSVHAPRCGWASGSRRRTETRRRREPLDAVSNLAVAAGAGFDEASRSAASASPPPRSAEPP